MQFQTLVFMACQVAASGYALARGGWPERIVAVELVVAAVVQQSLDLTFGHSFRSVEWRDLTIDAVLLAGLLPVAILANRYWPMWVAAVQLDTIALHGVRAMDPTLRPPVYFAMAGYAAYPILLLLALGTLRHRHREARAGGGEPAWTR